MIKKEKKQILLFCSILYVVIFLVAACFFYPKIQLQNNYTLPKDITYSGFDLIAKDQCNGQLYYSFAEKELRFYLLSAKRFPAKAGDSVHGHFEKSEKQLQDFYKVMANTVGWEQEELEQLAHPSYFVEQKPLAPIQKLALFFANAILLYSIYNIRKAIKNF